MAYANLQDYKQLIDDRPRKFGEEESGFGESDDFTYQCRHCMHWYENPVRGFRVCEVVRPKSEDVLPDKKCMFWTQDGVYFPLLKKDTDGVRSKGPAED